MIVKKCQRKLLKQLTLTLMRNMLSISVCNN